MDQSEACWAAKASGETPCLRQLLDVYEFYGAPVVALMEVPGDAISAYEILTETIEKRLRRYNRKLKQHHHHASGEGSLEALNNCALHGQVAIRLGDIEERRLDIAGVIQVRRQRLRHRLDRRRSPERRKMLHLPGRSGKSRRTCL